MGYDRPNKPNGFWKNLASVSEELKPFVEKFNGLPNSGYFKRINRKDIMCGIYHYGGYQKLANDLDVELVQTVVQQSNCTVPIGYWHVWENLLKELQPLIAEFGTVPSCCYVKKMSGSLDTAMRYHGGYKRVREKLNLPNLYDTVKNQPYGYWGNIQNVIFALKPLIEQYENVPSSGIIRTQNCGLAAAIERYHGGYIAIRKLLGLPERFYCKEKTRISIYREIGLENFGHKCVVCQYEEDVDVHHIDGNRLNNALENLTVLCPNHHRVVHKNKITSLEKILMLQRK